MVGDVTTEQVHCSDNFYRNKLKLDNFVGVLKRSACVLAEPKNIVCHKEMFYLSTLLNTRCRC